MTVSHSNSPATTIITAALLAGTFDIVAAVIHFMIATGGGNPIIVFQFIASGGLFVWLVMNLIVLPLSNVRQHPFRPIGVTVGILMLCPALPITMVIGRYYARRAIAGE